MINPIQFITIDDSSSGQRIDNFLFKILKNVPYSHVYKIINKGEVRVNKKRVSPSYKLSLADSVRVPPIFNNQDSVADNKPKIRTTLDLEVLFEDDHYIIINKPSGIACHGGSGISYGIIEMMRNQKDYKFLELAHRLDKNTSGVLVLAKKRAALLALQESIKKKSVHKEYLLLSDGVWEKDRFTVRAPLYKSTNKNNERFVRVDAKLGKDSQTEFEILKKFQHFTLVKAKLITGRTHQIRVHTQYIKHPIIGDDKYGDFELNSSIAKKYGFDHMFLHAQKFEFIHYQSEQKMQIFAELPESYKTLLNKII
jgi:23S rRNA pseudouridine955/2504/2580 synthase